MTNSATRKELRSFGLLWGVLLAGFFGALIPWIKSSSIPLWPWLVATIVFALAILVPTWLRPLQRAWLKLGDVLGAINSKIILTLVYALIFVPVRFVLKLLGKDPMQRNFQPGASYRQNRNIAEGTHVKNMDKPY